ncbi:glutaredoxin domain-containing protein [Mycobacterium sp. TY815]|uniref:glutaredoxin domain-containing protein n=1 Tax=Mycobacterium sp. TY815 TaxID=3050581 RepID=UPI0027406B62|nr:glutaredoxin domain-containing protein [Mycobacterium sp. TY815]MDP7703234.1 glutaredoxin domain-containing protein [Mycobacterium sp. TY815]
MSNAPVVTVYTSGPGCMACVQTKRHMDRRGIAYTEVVIGDDELTMEAIAYLGFRTAPVVCAATKSGEQVWDGYRPDRIDRLTMAVAS